MASESPQVDLYHPLIQALYQAFEQDAFPEGGIEDCDHEIGPLYNDEFKRPYVCQLVGDVVSGRWGLGTTQEEVSEKLGVTTDRSWVSRALHQGRLSLEIFLRLRCCPTRPQDWEPDICQLRSDMERSAFIGIARYLAARITDRPTLVPQRMNELSYELLCEVFARLGTWLPDQLNGRANAALEIVFAVSQDPRRNILPTWYTRRQRQAVEQELQRLTSQDAVAFEYLTCLQRDWIDVFVGTYAALELIKWRKE